jgi:putative sigma-54 modulation protein
VQVKVSTRHGHLSEASQEKIAAKVQKLLRINDRLTSADITIDLEDSAKPRVDLKVAAEHKHVFVAHDQSEELMGCVDNVVHRLEQQLRKHKEKVQDRHRGQDGRRAEAAEPSE